MMLSSKLMRADTARMCLRSGKKTFLASRQSRILPLRSFSSLQDWHSQGVVDEDGLTAFSTIHEMQINSCKVFAKNDLFGTYSEASQAFEFMSYSEFAHKVDLCRSVLKDLGVTEFGKVAIISNNRWEWAAIACAAYSINASCVPMYEAQLPTDWTYILNDSGSSVVFCATQDIFDRVQRDVLPSTPSVTASLCLDAPQGEAHAFATAMSKAEVDQSTIIKPTEEDLCNLIYTSGTTGKPKGVELTHLNFVSNVKAAGRSMVENPSEVLSAEDTSLAFLPWAHSYGQTCELWMGMNMGSSMGISRGVPLLLEDLQLVKPTVLFSVPTLYGKIYDGVHNLIEAASPLRKSLMQNALKLGHENALYRNGKRGRLGPMETIQFNLLDRIVLSKIRDRFGGNMRHGFVAGSACSPEVLRFMDALGIPICEGYGLTETSPIIAINVPTQRSIGSVGRPIGGVTVHIIGEDGQPVAQGEEGEICCVGPNVMKGYHNNKEATEEVISVAPDGKSRMFHTGDVGRLDEGGWLRVTGRIKEQYKLENGKYVVPTPIETAIGMSRFISQVVLHGANRPFNVALLVLEWNSIRAELDIGDEVTEEELSRDERVHRLIDGEIESHCAKLKKFEVPTKWESVAPFTTANNMLTPKMSIRRHKVVEEYKDTIGSMYGDEESAVETQKAA